MEFVSNSWPHRYVLCGNTLDCVTFEFTVPAWLIFLTNIRQWTAESATLRGTSYTRTSNTRDSPFTCEHLIIRTSVGPSTRTQCFDAATFRLYITTFTLCRYQRSANSQFPTQFQLTLPAELLKLIPQTCEVLLLGFCVIFLLFHIIILTSRSVRTFIPYSRCFGITFYRSLKPYKVVTSFSYLWKPLHIIPAPRQKYETGGGCGTYGGEEWCTYRVLQVKPEEKR